MLAIVFQQRKVPQEVNVVDALHDDFEQFGNICIDKDRYCGTTMSKDDASKIFADDIAKQMLNHTL